MDIDPVRFESMTEIDQLNEIAKKWNKLSDEKTTPCYKQKVIELKQKIKYSKNPMEIKQLQREIGKLSKVNTNI